MHDLNAIHVHPHVNNMSCIELLNGEFVFEMPVKKPAVTI